MFVNIPYLNCVAIHYPMKYKFFAECAGEKKIENRSIFGEDMDKNLRPIRF